MPIRVIIEPRSAIDAKQWDITDYRRGRGRWVRKHIPPLPKHPTRLKKRFYDVQPSGVVVFIVRAIILACTVQVITPSLTERTWGMAALAAGWAARKGDNLIFEV